VAWLDAEHRAHGYLEEFNITYPNAPDLGSRIAAITKLPAFPKPFLSAKMAPLPTWSLAPSTSKW
jgi:hypothetical protein